MKIEIGDRFRIAPQNGHFIVVLDCKAVFERKRTKCVMLVFWILPPDFKVRRVQAVTPRSEVYEEDHVELATAGSATHG